MATYELTDPLVGTPHQRNRMFPSSPAIVVLLLGVCCSCVGGKLHRQYIRNRSWRCSAFDARASGHGGMGTPGWVDSAGGATHAAAASPPVPPVPSRTMASRTR